MAIQNDLVIRLIAQDQLTTTLANIGDVINRKTEPAMKMIKSNLVTLDNRITNVVQSGGKLTQTFNQAQNQVNQFNANIKQAGSGTGKATGTIQKSTNAFGNFANSFQQFARVFSFTGFIFAATFRRINSAALDFTKGIMGMVLGMTSTDKAIAWLGDELYALALSGDLTKEKTDELVKTFWDFFNAIKKMGGAMAMLKGYIQPFINSAIEIVAEGVTRINNKIAELKASGTWAQIEAAWSGAVKTFTDKLVTKIIEFLDKLKDPEYVKKIENIAAALAGFVTGIASAKFEAITWLLDKLGNFGPDTAESIGKIFGQLELLGVAMTVLGVPLQILSMGFKGLSTLLGGEVPKVLTTIVTKLGGVVPALGIVAAAALILYFAWDDIVKIWNESLGPALGRLWDSLNKIIPVWDLLNSLISVADQLISALVGSALEGISWLIDSLATVFDWLAQIFGWNKTKTGGNTGGNTGSNTGSNTSGSPEGFEWYEDPVTGERTLVPKSKQVGGPITQAGMYRLHVGERVIPEPQASGKVTSPNLQKSQPQDKTIQPQPITPQNNFITNYISIGNISSEIDIEYLRSEINRSIANATQRNGYMGRGR